MRLSMSRVLVAASLLFAVPAAAQQQEGIDFRLRSAGFKVRAAITPRDMEHLNKLPPRKIVSRTRNGQTYYVYADPDFCKCAMIGNAAALQAYNDMIAPQYRPDIFAGGGQTSEGAVIHAMDDDLDSSTLDSAAGPSIFDNPYFD